MNLKNKTFKNNLTGDVVTVIDSFENIVILDDRTRVSPLVLLNPNLYTEITALNESLAKVDDQVDVNNFFGNQNAYNSLAERIKSIPPDQMGNNNDTQISTNIDANITPSTTFQPLDNENIVYETTEESEKEALAKKYGILQPDINSLNKQNESFSRILGSDDELPVIHTPVYDTHEPVQRIEVERESGIEYHSPTQHVVIEDPIIRMFKGVKRNVDFSVNIELSDKIPRVDFIEMMEDSYETSIIDFLADEFTEKILNDPEMIRSIIKDKIKKMVYSSEWTSSDLSKQKTPLKKGTLNVEKSVSIDIDKQEQPVQDIETKNEAPVKKKRSYKKKSEIANG